MHCSKMDRGGRRWIRFTGINPWRGSDNPGVQIGFIPTACGGASVEVWVPGAFLEGTQSHPYDDALARVEAVRHRGELKGILWHQGEADSRPDRVEPYRQRLAGVFWQLRHDLGEPDLPIIIGQLGQFAGKEWTEERYEVDAIHQWIARSDDRIEFVSSEGLTAKEDLLHFDAAGLDEFGQRYAEAWAKLVAKLED